MLLGGLWHGAALRFIIWGGLHGFGLVVNRLWELVARGRLMKGRFGKFIGIIITFNFVSFCWIFFRAQDIASVYTMLSKIFSDFDLSSVAPVIKAYSGVFILIVTGYIIHFLPEKIKEAYRGTFIKAPVALQFAIVLVIASFLYQMRVADVIPFIYFRF
jgi:D-alanyl-lipoteichoic acid acyltransferase DltB (MBOAT superfamily)